MALTKVIGSGVEGISNSSNATAITIDSSEKVGIGETSPQGILHIKSADAGTTADGGADELVIEGSGNSGITIASGASSSGAIYFADSGSAYDGWITYSHSNRQLNFATAQTTRLTINSSGAQQHIGDYAAGYIADFRNDGNNANRYGISIDCGLDASDGTSPTSNLWAVLNDGNGDNKAYLMWVNGSSNAALVSASDERIKTDIAPTKVNALEVLENIPLSEFKMARKDKPIGELVKIGFIAQDCEQAWPDSRSCHNRDNSFPCRAERLPLVQ